MKKFICLFLFINLNIFSQTEFIVNSTTDTTQRDSQIEKINDDHFVIVWDSESRTNQSDIYLQFFNMDGSKFGDEILVNQKIEGEQERPAIALNGNGDLIVTWASYESFSSIYDVKARIYKNFLPIGDEFIVNTNIEATQTNPDVAGLSNGDFIIVWESWFQDGSDKGIYAQRLSTDGSKSGNEFLINSTTSYSQARPVINKFTNDDFIVVWESWRQDNPSQNGYGIFGKIFTNNTSVKKDEFQINTYTNDYQWFGDVETFDDNSFVVTWCSWRQDGHDGGIYLQKFNSTGDQTGTEIQVNKTTQYYQWLPKIKKLDSENFAVVWSSWLQDGSREGIYAQYFDKFLRKSSFETKVNDYVNDYQWEPDFIITGEENEILVTWSSYGILNKDYEVIAKKFKPLFPVGYLDEDSFEHNEGRTTSRFLVHIIDSTQVTGDDYEITFNSFGDAKKPDSVLATIKNISTSELKITDFKINKGTNYFYLTEVFEGIAVEFLPILDFDLDLSRSFFLNNTGSNLILNLVPSTFGTKNIAPIDAVIIWGNTDTLVNGQYSAPLDTAIGTNGQRNVVVPFKAWNITDNAKINLLVAEPSNRRNGRWDPDENLILLTPAPYSTAGNNTHSQISFSLPSETLILPGIGDSVFFYTKRPLSSNDKFSFSTKKENLISEVESRYLIPESFKLFPNYPNPFNPTTTISYTIQSLTKVELNIYNVIGEKVTTLINEYQPKGNYRVLFNGEGLSSGVYIASLKAGNYFNSIKMLLIK